MASKDEFLSLKDKSIVNYGSQTSDKNNQYSNLNLNQNQNSSALISVHSYSKSNNDKFCSATFKLPDSTFEETEKSQKWNCLNTKKLYYKTEKEEETIQKNKNFLNTNKSTLSLNISAYENSIESAAVSDSFESKSVGLKPNKINSNKQVFYDLIIQNPFEFPRQQAGGRKTDPELSQFKASQRLLNPNQSAQGLRPSTMSLDAPKTEDDIYNEVRSQLAKILMTQEHTIYNLERQSKEVSEYPIHTLARQAGFRNTREMLEEWFGDLVDTEGETIRAYSSLYDTPELQHIISLQERTKMKTRKGGFTRRGRGGGGRGGGRAGQATNRPIPLRAPPSVGRRDPLPQPPPMRRPYSPPRRQQSPPRRQISPPRGFTTGGFTVRQSVRPPAQLAAATSPRRQLSPGGESIASSRREQPLSLNRITSPYGHDRRLSPPGSVHNYSSASTEIAQPDYLDEYGSQARGRRGYNDTPDYVDRTERTVVPGPPPGFVDDRQHVEVRARRYESVASPDITSTRTYDYNRDDDADPFGTNTAVLLHNDEYVNVPTYETVHPRQEERLPTRQEQFYDDEFEREYYIPARETATPYVSTRQAYDDRQPSPRHVYDDRQLPRRHAYDARQPSPRLAYDDRRLSPRRAREPAHNYQNGYRGRQEPSPPPVPQNGYDRYGHHRVDERSRERSTNLTPDAEIFHDAADNFNHSETKYDSLPTIDLPPCRTFVESEKPIRQTLLCNNEYASISALLSHPFIPEESSKPPYSTNYFEYFCEVMVDIHSYCSERISDGRPPPVLNNILRELLQKVNFEPGYDAWSIYYVMKELGPAFFDFREDKTYEPGFAVLRVIDTCVIQNDAEYKRNIKQVLRHLLPELNIPELFAETSVKAVIFQSKDENFPYFVKLHKTLKDEKDLENLLRTAPTLDMINPYPGALCIYRRNTVPYRAQIIAEISTNKISIELVDVGVFLTVPISDLKRVESIDLSLKPRYAIPVQLVNHGEKKLVFVDADDGFPRKSTNKTVSMILTPRNKYMSMTLY